VEVPEAVQPGDIDMRTIDSLYMHADSMIPDSAAGDSMRMDSVPLKIDTLMPDTIKPDTHTVRLRATGVDRQLSEALFFSVSTAGRHFR
jgi:hypothetical protein